MTGNRGVKECIECGMLCYAERHKLHEHLTPALDMLVAPLHLIEPSEPDHPASYYEGWHAALEAVAKLAVGKE